MTQYLMVNKNKILDGFITDSNERYPAKTALAWRDENYPSADVYVKVFE